MTVIKKTLSHQVAATVIYWTNESSQIHPYTSGFSMNGTKNVLISRINYDLNFSFLINIVIYILYWFVQIYMTCHSLTSIMFHIFFIISRNIAFLTKVFLRRKLHNVNVIKKVKFLQF